MHFNFAAWSYKMTDVLKYNAFVNIGHMLVENGANPNATNLIGNTALMLAAERGKSFSMANKYLELCVQICIYNGFRRHKYDGTAD